MAKLVLVSDYSPFLSICKLLAKEGHRFACLGGFAQVLADLDIPARPLADAVAPVQDRAFNEAARILSIAGTFQQNGLGPGPAQFINQKLSAFLYPRLADLVALTLALDIARPDLVLLQNDVVPIHRLIALWCKAHSVPCLHVPHAIYQMVNRGELGTDVHDLVTASHLAAAGPFQAKWYRKLSNEIEIRETGLPQFDGLLKEIGAVGSSKRARQILRLDPKHPVVSYFSTWPQHTNAAGVNDEWQVSYYEFLKGMRQLKGVQIIVKCHPGGGQQNWQWHAEVVARSGLDYLVTPANLAACILASDLWLAYGGSNTILDAAHVDGVRLATTHGFTNDGAVIKVPMEATAYTQAVGEALGKPARSTVKLLAKYIGDPDGLASERIAEWCQELLA